MGRTDAGSNIALPHCSVGLNSWCICLHAMNVSSTVYCLLMKYFDAFGFYGKCTEFESVPKQAEYTEKC